MSLWMSISLMSTCSLSCKLHQESSLSVPRHTLPWSLAQSCTWHVQSYPALATPWTSPPGSPVPGLLQARTLEWAAMPSSRGSSRPRDGTQVSRIGRWVLSRRLGSPLHVVGTQQINICQIRRGERGKDRGQVEGI